MLRADSGQVVKTGNDSTNFLNYFVGFGALNMTILAPSDTAFKTAINFLSGGQVPLGAPNAVFLGFINSALSVTNARGIIAYHFLASTKDTVYRPNIRVFSVNVPTSATFVSTLLNNSFRPHQGIKAIATFAGPFATPTFAGVGTVLGIGAQPPANVIEKDTHGVNGVLHIIDRVLVP